MKDFLGLGGVGRLAGFWLCCCQACFAYVGCELTGIAAEEAEQPRSTLPKAVRRVSARLIMYYLGMVFVLGLNLSSNDPILAWYVSSPSANYQSPFVLMVQRANIPGLDHLLNALILFSLVCILNTYLYVGVTS